MSKKEMKKKAPQKSVPISRQAERVPLKKTEEPAASIRQAEKAGPPLPSKKPSERQMILQAQQDEQRQRLRRRWITVGVVVGLLAAVILSLVFGSRKPTITAALQQEGSLNCFASDLVDEQGAPLDCDVSAVLYDGSNLNLATGKTIPGAGFSSIFRVPFAESKVTSETVSYLTAEPFLKATDFQSLAISSDGAYLFAMTGFDRVDNATSDLNDYNTLLGWPTSDPEKVQVVSATTTADGVKSSVSMRYKFAQLLEGAAYFRVGGMTAIPGNYLIFGLTDIGASAENNQALIKIITVPYSVNAESGEITLSDRYQVKYTLEPAKSNPEIPHELSLTSLEYDPYRNLLLIMAGYDEGEQGSGAYLWSLSISDMNNANPPALVTQADGKPYEIAGHPRGLTVIGQDTYLIATNAAGRGPQQATYQIITLSR